MHYDLYTHIELCTLRAFTKEQRTTGIEKYSMLITLKLFNKLIFLSLFQLAILYNVSKCPAEIYAEGIFIL